MRKRALTIFLSHSLASHKQNPVFHPALLSRQNLILILTRFTSSFASSSSSSPRDDLQGWVDPGDPVEDCRVESFTAEEFASLRDSLLSPNNDTQMFGPGKCSNDAVSIANVIMHNHDGFGNNTQKLLRQFRQKLSPSLVVEVLGMVNNPELGVKFFIWAGRQIGYYHTLPVYNALLEIMERDSDYKRANERLPEHFLREIKEDDKEVLGKLLNVFIRNCCQNGMWNAALEELGRLKDLGYKPSRLTYNALVQVFLRFERLDTASLIHREMVGLGYRMDEFTLGCFAHSLCKAGKWREALALIEKEEFVPNTVLYTKMISGLCEASLFEEAMDFLNRMRASSCLPNVVTYRILLCGCLGKKQLGRCKRILNMMITEGCYPSPQIFNSLVHAYCRSADYSYAYKLLKKMEKCGNVPGYVVYNILIGGICGNEELPNSDSLDLAEQAYAEMLNAGVVLNKVNVSNFARCLCGVGKFDKAYNVIREMMSKGFIPDTSTYSKVIGYLCNAFKVEMAFLLFQEMIKNGVTPDVHIYTTLIDSFCKAGLIEQARHWFNEMESVGCAPNVVTYTALIHSYLKARKVAGANELFEMMLSKGCLPNIVTYTALIDGYCKAGEIEKACQIYAQMKKAKVDTLNGDMCFQVVDMDAKEPNVFTYGALIDGLCKAHKVKEARELLEAMSVEGCEPNQIVYDALIDGCCKVGKIDEAQEVFTKMLEHGFSPNVYTYSSLIDRLFKDKRLDLALKVLSKMLESSCPPNVVTYTEMIDGLCKVGKTDEAYKLMIMMEEKGCYPNVVTYTAMIDGFGKVGKVEKSLELLQQMCSKGCAPNFVTYSVLINHCCSAGLLNEAHRLLEEMKQTYWPRHKANYNKVIEGFNREFVASLGLLVEMGGNDSMPISPAYRLLINHFIKVGRLEKAVELNEELSSFSSFSAAQQNIYVSLIENLSLTHKVDKAFKLYAEMIERGGVPELSVFVHLIKGLVRVNRWEEALQLSHGMCQMGVQWVHEEDAIGHPQSLKFEVMESSTSAYTLDLTTNAKNKQTNKQTVMFSINSLTCSSPPPCLFANRSIALRSPQTVFSAVKRGGPPRTLRRNNHNPSKPYSEIKAEAGRHPKSNADDQTLELVIDVPTIKAAVSSKLEQLVVSTDDAFRDLSTLVTVEENSRIVLSCRKSTLQYCAVVLLCGFLAGFPCRALGRLWFGFWRGLKKQKALLRRDRSLGGREVVLAAAPNAPRVLEDPLSLYIEPGPERSYWDRSKRKVPKWWPESVAEDRDLLLDEEDSRRQANRLVREITSNRTAGKDVSENNVIQLRQICRASGVQVSFGTTNTRDAFYRAAINFVLDACSRAASSSVEIAGENAQHFIAGLAENIGLEIIRAARMVSAAVATRTRSSFLQAWALEVQGKHSEAVTELSRLCLVLQTFPAEETSPEMEAVARGLGKHLKLEQREILMKMFTTVCSEESHRSAADALGKFDFHNPNNPYRDAETDYSYTATDQSLQLVLLDVNRVKAAASSKLERLVVSTRDAFHDLRTLVALDENNRIVFSCRRSTLEYCGVVLLCGFVAVSAFKALGRLWLGFRRRLVSGQQSVVVRRDRSLGGREVVVAVADTRPRQDVERKKSARVLDDPLSLSGSDIESGLEGDGWRSHWDRSQRKLPKWWPESVADGRDFSLDYEECRRQAYRLVREISNNRTAGKDVSRSDVIQIAGENPQHFIAGLAENIGLENIRAARMVSAAVAVRTRSSFLQAWALEVQGKHSEAVSELSTLCLVLQAFPPEESSPEMEMVARGLGKHLKLEQREILMRKFTTVCSEESHRSAADALGLVSSHFLTFAESPLEM
ncbi:hypothetical protein Tsubulata_029969 [Turnera subulata]|uniref:Pentatricopeptide repeat-containing protein n=1 Tax=Turnera subulata TaxID=218843 RepID=A0A9Q0FZ10_9ROSI|nr:hypothetical protein Tsubulata_029969 [Turnera subulata]